MSTVGQYNIESPTNVSIEPSKILWDIFNNILNESSVLQGKLIGTRFLHLAEKPSIVSNIEQKAKTNLELMEELGLLGALEDEEVTSVNRKKFIKNSFKNRSWNQ